VHFFARLMSEEQYGLFGTFLQSLLPQLAIPSLAIQAAFVQLSAAAVTTEQERNLAAAVRRVALVMGGLWLAAAILVTLFSGYLLEIYKLGSVSGLVILMATVLASLLLPIFSGIIQGRQDFLWFGWVTMLGGLGRVAGVGLMVGLFGGTALNAMLGALIGQVASLLVAVWRSQTTWRQPPGTFALVGFIGQVAPLTLALGALTVLQTADIGAAREALTGQESGIYTAAGSVARSVLYLAAPMVWVMFPRIVREAATSQRSSVLAQACAVSLLVCGSTALAATFFPELPFRIVQGGRYLDASRLLPLVAWSFLPLMLTTILLNNLLARSRFNVVWPLMAVAAGYWLALRHFNQSPEQIIGTLGAAATSALLVVGLFTWLESRAADRSQPIPIS
jgi:O-antigen/teichoic acid export membrane protein